MGNFGQGETLLVAGIGDDRELPQDPPRHGADAGYRAIVVTDGTSTINDEWQNAGLNYALENIAERASTADLIAALGG